MSLLFDISSLTQVVRKALGSDRVKKVSGFTEANVDGELISRVRIVYDNAKGELTPGEMIDVTERLWDFSSREGNKAFPVTDFISAEDDAREAAAA